MTAAPAPSTGSVVLDEVAEVIGRDAALALAFAFRGERLYVPKDPARSPRIAEAIGEEAANRFCNAFYGTTIPMPAREAVRVQVHALARAGMARRDIARALGIGERQVYRMLESGPDGARPRGRRRPHDPRQQDLF